MLYKKLSYIIFTTIFAFTFISCSDDSTGIDESSATINGSVESSSSSQQDKATSNSNEGVVITAARVTSSGTLETIGETETNASGNFSLDVNTDVANHIVITAQTEVGEMKGYLSEAVQNGHSYTLKPINTESSAETEIYTELVAEGNADLVQKSEVDMTVTSEVAAKIQSSNSAAAEIAAGLTNYAEAKAEFLADMGESEVDAKLNQAADAKTEAQFHYEAELAGSSSVNEKETAFDTFLEAYLTAYTEAEFEHESIAKLAHMRVNVIQNTFSSASADVEDVIYASTSLFAALAVDAAARTNAEASGMSDASVSAIADAGTSLKNEIKTSANASADVEAAFQTYHEEVRQAMENDSSTEAGVILEIDSEINVSGGSKAVFNSALSNVISVNLLSDVYMSFTNSIESNVDGKSDSLGELNAEAIANLFILINLNS